jgi:hypothetical protein
MPVADAKRSVDNVGVAVKDEGVKRPKGSYKVPYDVGAAARAAMSGFERRAQPLLQQFLSEGRHRSNQRNHLQSDSRQAHKRTNCFCKASSGAES